MALSETGIGLLDGPDLLGGELNFPVQGLFLEFQKPLIPGSHFMSDENLLNRGTGNGNPHELEVITQACASPHGIGERKFKDLLHNLGRSGLGMGLVNGRKILQL